MPTTPDPTYDQSQPWLYQIRIEGHLGPQWQERFECLDLTLADNGQTLISGPALDQAAVYRLLKKIRDLGLRLVSVARIAPEPVNYDQ